MFCYIISIKALCFLCTGEFDHDPMGKQDDPMILAKSYKGKPPRFPHGLKWFANRTGLTGFQARTKAYPDLPKPIPTLPATFVSVLILFESVCLLE